MLAINVCHYGDDGGELQERSIAFVRFDNQEIAVPDAGVRTAHGIDAAADDDGGI